MKKKLRKDWMLGFLGFMSFTGFRYFLTGGEWLNLILFSWVIWFVYFIPIKSE